MALEGVWTPIQRGRAEKRSGSAAPRGLRSTAHNALRSFPQGFATETRAFGRQTQQSVPKLGGRHTQNPGDGMGFGLQHAANRGAK